MGISLDQRTYGKTYEHMENLSISYGKSMKIDENKCPAEMNYTDDGLSIAMLFAIGYRKLWADVV